MVVVLLVGACGVNQNESPVPAGAGGTVVGGSDGPPDAGSDAPVCAYGQLICEGDVAKVCDGQGGYTSVNQCPTGCENGLGCVQCVPKASSCASKLARICDATGSTESTFLCDGPGMSCDADGCKGECSPSSLGMSYIGCEFWPTVTANSVFSDRGHVSDAGTGSGDGFHFGLILGNASSSEARVTITGPSTVQPFTIPAGETRTVALDWVYDLKGPDWDVPYEPVIPTQSVRKTNGAYRVQSDKPIIAYQFNSLESEIPDSRDCPSLPGAGGRCYSHSSDGSLLIPAHALSSSYVVAGYHGWHKEMFPLAGSLLGKLNMGDFIAITATQPNTEVTLTLPANQSVLSGPDLPRFAAGGPTTFTMSAGQVVQLFTPGGSNADTFSGTQIVAKDNKPLQVLSGIGCAAIFSDESRCGHMEESVLPVDALGKDYVVPVLSSGSASADAGTPIAHTIRIQAVSDGTAITFEPNLFTAVTLARGEVHERENVTSNLRISSMTPFAVTQYPSGRPQASRGSAENLGNPNQLAVAPVSQFRTSYSFVVSSQFSSNFVSVIAPTGTAVSLDRQPVPPERFIAVGASGMSVARLSVTQPSRVHVVSADKPVGILVYGFAPYASYAFLGGLDLKRTAAPVVR